MIYQNNFLGLKKIISEKKRIVKEMISFSKSLEKVNSIEERKTVISQIISLKKILEKSNEDTLKILNKISLTKLLPTQIKKDIPEKLPDKKSLKKVYEKNIKLSEFEKATLKRLGEKEKKSSEEKIKKPSEYVKISNRLFSNISKSFLEEKIFSTLKRDLIKANLHFLPRSYVSVILFTTLLSVIAAVFAFVFFLFFNIGPELPIITFAGEGIGARLVKVFWILFAIPIGTFLLMYFYPSMEKKSTEHKINQELPFATIHMSAISGSMIEPSKIFSIIILTKEYPYLEKEFVKLMNEINILGYDLVNALKNSAFNSPSKKLAELFNGLATTITSGGVLSEFFDKRSQSLLFDYKINREKHTRSAETFMDIYISVVIAAPMILMLLLMMMKISGLGISISTGMITLIMILGVSAINVVFLTFLHLKQSSE